MTTPTTPREPLDLERNREPVCPHCGAAMDQQDTLEMSVQYDGDTTETDCLTCEQPMHVTVHVDYRYTTRTLQ